MSVELQLFLQDQLKKVYAQYLVETVSRVQSELCYGCSHKADGALAHNLCQMNNQASIVEFCLIHALNRVEDDKVMETYAERMGLAALEWIEAYDYGYKRGIWMNSDSWKKDIVSLILAHKNSV